MTMTGWRDYLELRGMVRAMSDVARLNILHQLAGGRETNVTELVTTLGISQPLVSWHLRILRRHGLVRTRRQGREVYCGLDASRFAECLRGLGELVAAPDTPEPPAHTPRADTPTSEPLTTLASGVRPAPLSRTSGRSPARAGPPDS
jgi:DNA-binding transcriptional ArsR family regulator